MKKVLIAVAFIAFMSAPSFAQKQANQTQSKTKTEVASNQQSKTAKKSQAKKHHAKKAQKTKKAVTHHEKKEAKDSVAKKH